MVSKEEEKKEIKKPTLITVRVVQSRGKSAVVEWVDKKKAFRKIVPVKDVDKGKIDKDILDKSPDYGVPWAKEVDPKASPEDIENCLHNAGVWTSEDALTKPGAIIGALNAAYKVDLVAILKAAKKYTNKE